MAGASEGSLDLALSNLQELSLVLSSDSSENGFQQGLRVERKTQKEDGPLPDLGHSAHQSSPVTQCLLGRGYLLPQFQGNQGPSMQGQPSF